MKPHRDHRIPPTHRVLDESGELDYDQLKESLKLMDGMIIGTMTSVSNPLLGTYTSESTAPVLTPEEIKETIDRLMDVPTAPFGAGPITLTPNSFMTKTEEYERTWKERLWSRPWKPWRKNGYRQIPDPEIFVVKLPGSKTQTIMGHPDTLRNLERDMESL